MSLGREPMPRRSLRLTVASPAGTYAWPLALVDDQRSLDSALSTGALLAMAEFHQPTPVERHTRTSDQWAPSAQFCATAWLDEAGRVAQAYLGQRLSA